MINVKTKIDFLKEKRKQLFWYWIGYQCVKGTLTTSLIWVPAIVIMMK